MNDLLQFDDNLTLGEAADRLTKLATYKKQIETAYNAYRDKLLAATKQHDVLTLKTGSYTITRACRTTPKVEDYETLKVSLQKGNIPFTTKEVFGDEMTEVFKQAIKEGRELDGLSSTTTEYVSVRVNGDK